MYYFPNLEPVFCSMYSSNCCFSDLHTDFLGGRSRGLVFPSLEEFSTVCFDPHSQSGVEWWLCSAGAVPAWFCSDYEETPYIQGQRRPRKIVGTAVVAM